VARRGVSKSTVSLTAIEVMISRKASSLKTSFRQLQQTERRQKIGLSMHIPDHGLAFDCFVDCGIELVVGEAVEPDRVKA